MNNSQCETAQAGTVVGGMERTPNVKRSFVGESFVWQPVGNGWRQLFGGFRALGVSVEWHDFEIAGSFDWARSFHPGSLELCLNLAGQASIHSADGAINFEPLTAGFYAPGKQGCRASREGGQRHRFVTIEFAPRFLRGRLAASDGALHPVIERFIQRGHRETALGPIHQLSVLQEQRISELLNPPVAQGGRELWFEGRILEFMAEFFFERADADELFCDRQKRLARERTDRVLALLRKNLAEPLTLDEIGREVGCSPFHLSRTFSREMGRSIPQYLRMIRMEQAAELLKSGKYNVTEAALAVGYSSLSHFSQAFCETMGCCPGLYPLERTGKLRPKTPPVS